MDTLKKLGYEKGTKLLMIHADDAGLSHSENLATIEGLQMGSINSYSIMVPCQGFEEIADFALKYPQFDYGIHLTLTCEWKDYKFGPVAPLKNVESLADSNGHFYKNRSLLKSSAKVDEVEIELIAQIEKALDYGLKPTHLDSHMYSLGINDEFISVYKKVGQKYGLPILINKDLLKSIDSSYQNSIGSDDFIVDKVYVGEYKDFEKDSLSNYYDFILNNLDAGLNMILIHPAFDDIEMQRITEDHPNFGSRWRQIDFDFFTSQKCKSILKENDTKMISWNQITKLLK